MTIHATMMAAPISELVPQEPWPALALICTNWTHVSTYAPSSHLAAMFASVLATVGSDDQPFFIHRIEKKRGQGLQLGKSPQLNGSIET